MFKSCSQQPVRAEPTQLTVEQVDALYRHQQLLAYEEGTDPNIIECVHEAAQIFANEAGWVSEEDANKVPGYTIHSILQLENIADKILKGDARLSKAGEETNPDAIFRDEWDMPTLTTPNELKDAFLHSGFVIDTLSTGCVDVWLPERTTKLDVHWRSGLKFLEEDVAMLRALDLDKVVKCILPKDSPWRQKAKRVLAFSGLCSTDVTSDDSRKPLVVNILAGALALLSVPQLNNVETLFRLIASEIEAEPDPFSVAVQDQRQRPERTAVAPVKTSRFSFWKRRRGCCSDSASATFLDWHFPSRVEAKDIFKHRFAFVNGLFNEIIEYGQIMLADGGAGAIAREHQLAWMAQAERSVLAATLRCAPNDNLPHPLRFTILCGPSHSTFDKGGGGAATATGSRTQERGGRALAGGLRGDAGIAVDLAAADGQLGPTFREMVRGERRIAALNTPPLGSPALIWTPQGKVSSATTDHESLPPPPAYVKQPEASSGVHVVKAGTKVIATRDSKHGYYFKGQTGTCTYKGLFSRVRILWVHSGEVHRTKNWHNAVTPV